MLAYTLTSEQLHKLKELFQCVIEVEEDGGLRVADGDSVSSITLYGDIVQHHETGLSNEEVRRYRQRPLGATSIQLSIRASSPYGSEYGLLGLISYS